MYENLKNFWVKSLFKPSFLSPFFNPFFLIRASLYFSIKASSQLIVGDYLLDFGCGKKPYKKFFKVKEYIGLDVDGGAHQLQNDDVDFYFDGKLIPFSDNSFDVVLATEVFEHVFNLDETLREIKRVLRPDGFLIVTIPFFWEEHEEPYDFARYTSFGFESIIKSKNYKIIFKQKTGNESLVICQLLINFFWKRTFKIFNGFALIFLPFYSSFFLFIFLIPAILESSLSSSKKVYFNNVFVLMNIK